MKLIILTGLSGSGKSCAVSVLEDLGYYCIDNIYTCHAINTTMDKSCNDTVSIKFAFKGYKRGNSD